MLVRMCSIWAHSVYGCSRHGDIVKVPTEVGEDLIKQRHAMTYVAEEKKAPKPKVEKRGGRRSGRNDSTGSGSDHSD